MWYVIHTKTGFEYDLVQHLFAIFGKDVCQSYLIPMFEDVHRTGGISRISYRKMFPGYVLVETDEPEGLAIKLRKVPEYTRLLGDADKRENRIFVAIEENEMLFLQSILNNGVMSVSYVERVRGTRIQKIVGPLAKYGNRITKIEFRKRRAIVEAYIFGKMRKIRFGLWTDEDPKIPWIEKGRGGLGWSECLLTDIDIGLHPGDVVKDMTGIYGDEEFVVESVNPNQRTFRTKIQILGGSRVIEMYVDFVEKVRKGDRDGSYKKEKYDTRLYYQE